MFDRIMGLLNGTAEGDAEENTGATLNEAEIAKAAAALLVHAARIDGELADGEQQKLKALLQERFKLGADELSELIASANAAERDAVDLYRFTSVLMRNLDESGRQKIVEMLWQVAFADGVIHEFEDNLVWRVAELLHVSTRDRMLMKQKARADASKAE